MAEMSRRSNLGQDSVVLLVYKGITLYNGKMGGVDAWDAIRTGYFAVEMVGRTSKWTVRFVDAMFNMQLAQAWVAYRHVNKLSSDARLAFHQSICAAFLDNIEDDKRSIATRQREKEEQAARFGKHHHQVPTTLTDEKEKRGDKRTRLIAQNCAYCLELPAQNRKGSVKGKINYSIRTTLMCEECDVYLHVECFADYHNSR
jgi:hypothetical protein